MGYPPRRKPRKSRKVDPELAWRMRHKLPYKDIAAHFVVTYQAARAAVLAHCRETGSPVPWPWRCAPPKNFVGYKVARRQEEPPKPKPAGEEKPKGPGQGFGNPISDAEVDELLERARGGRPVRG